jgi:hypothetical protein
MGNCKDCANWLGSKLYYGECSIRTESNLEPRELRTDSAVIAVKQVLVTGPQFGCNQFQAKSIG